MTDTFSILDAEDNETMLDGTAGIKVLSARGLFMPPMDHETDDIPLSDGEYLRDAKVESNRIRLEIGIEGSSPADLRSKLNELTYSLLATRGDCKLKVVGPSSGEYYINCRYRDGLGLRLDQRNHGSNWHKADIDLEAYDPFWYGSDITDQYTTGETAGWFPIFPLTLSASGIFADADINNIGRYKAFPRWAIMGPGTNPILRNTDTGEYISITYTLGEGESIAIDTRLGIKTILLNDGTNLRSGGYVSRYSTLFPLAKGTNSIRLEMTGSNDNSYLSCTYAPRYLGPEG